MRLLTTFVEGPIFRTSITYYFFSTNAHIRLFRAWKKYMKKLLVCHKYSIVDLHMRNIVVQHTLLKSVTFATQVRNFFQKMRTLLRN